MSPPSVIAPFLHYSLSSSSSVVTACLLSEKGFRLFFKEGTFTHTIYHMAGYSSWYDKYPSTHTIPFSSIHYLSIYPTLTLYWFYLYQFVKIMIHLGQDRWVGIDGSVGVVYKLDTSTFIFPSICICPLNLSGGVGCLLFLFVYLFHVKGFFGYIQIYVSIARPITYVEVEVGGLWDYYAPHWLYLGRSKLGISRQKSSWQIISKGIWSDYRWCSIWLVLRNSKNIKFDKICCQIFNGLKIRF